MSPTTVGRWFDGDTRPDPAVWERLDQALHVDVGTARALLATEDVDPLALAVRLAETEDRLAEAERRLGRLEHLADTLAPQIPANAAELARLLRRLDDLARAVMPSPAGPAPGDIELMPGLAP